MRKALEEAQTEICKRGEKVRRTRDEDGDGGGVLSRSATRGARAAVDEDGDPFHAQEVPHDSDSCVG